MVFFEIKIWFSYYLYCIENKLYSYIYLKRFF